MSKRAAPAKTQRKEYEKGLRPTSHLLASEFADKVDEHYELGAAGARRIIDSFSHGQLAVTVDLSGVRATPDAIAELHERSAGKLTEVWLLSPDTPETVRQLIRRHGTKRVRC